MKSLNTGLIRVALALAVAFWMAGGGCMLGCENMVETATTVVSSPAGAASIVASGEACASMHSHDCCAKHGKKRAATSRAEADNRPPATAAVTVNLSGASNLMMDCPLAVNATAALSKAKQDQSSGALPLTRTNGFIPSLHEQATALSTPARLPNRGHTYLRCCVFLI